MSRDGQKHAATCTTCGGAQGYFSDARYRAVLLHGWDGAPKHDPAMLNMVYAERNFRCAQCSAGCRQPTKARPS